MSIQENKSIIVPSLTDMLVNFKQDIFSTMNCVKIGEINSFDPAKKTAEVQILFKRVLPNGTIVSYPLLIDVPVVTLQGGGGAIQFPIQPGDQCLLLFSDRRIDEWFQNGGESVPGDARMHHMSDAIAIVGVNAVNSTLPEAPTDQVVISYGQQKFILNGTGFQMTGSGGAEIDLSAAIITIKNNSTTLLTLLNGLITVLEGLQVTGPLALTPASVSTLEAYKLQLATLLG